MRVKKYDVFIYAVVVAYCALLGGALPGENASFESRYIPMLGGALVSTIGCVIGHFAKRMARPVERRGKRIDLLGMQLGVISTIVSFTGFMAVGYGYQGIGYPLIVAGFIPVVPAIILHHGAVSRNMRED